MTHDGVKQLMIVITSAYPNYHPTDMAKTIHVWESILKDYKDSDVAEALRRYIISDTKGFAPAIGQIIDMMHKDESLGELEAWGLVRKAIRNGVYGAEEEFSKLPDEARLALGSPGQLRDWAMMSVDSVDSVAQSNFLRAYRSAVARVKEAQKGIGTVNVPQIAETTVYIEDHTDGVPMPEELKRKMGMKE